MQRIISVLKKVDDFFSEMAKILTAISICAQMIIMFLGVVCRYFFKNPLIWSDELSCYLLVIVTFFGSYVALKEKSLARIEIFTERMNEALRKLVVSVANITTIFLLGAVAYFGIMLSFSPVVLKAASPSMQLPTVIFYILLPISTAMMVLHMFIVLYEGLVPNPGDKYKKEDII